MTPTVLKPGSRTTSILRSSTERSIFTGTSRHVSPNSPNGIFRARTEQGLPPPQRLFAQVFVELGDEPTPRQPRVEPRSDGSLWA